VVAKNDKRPRNRRPVQRKRKAQAQLQKASGVVSRTQGNVLLMSHSDQDGREVDSGTQASALVGRDERLGEPSASPPCLCDDENSEGGHGEGQGAESIGEALGSPPVQDGYAGVTVVSLEAEIRRRRSQEIKMIESFVEAYFATLGVVAALGTTIALTLCFGMAEMYFSDRKEDRTR